MLIEALAGLAEKSRAERISIEITPIGSGKSDVLVITTLGQPGKVSESKEHGRMVRALAAPMHVTGLSGELDRKLVALCDDLESSVEEVAKGLPETDAAKRKRELLASTKPAKKKKGGKKAKKEEEVETEDDQEKALETGDADSL